MHSYFAYGLGIKSEMQLPDFPEAESNSPTDVLVKYGKAQPLEPIPTGAEICIQFKDREAYFFYNKLGSCRVSQGRSIIGEPCENIDNNADLRFLVQGPGISVVLHQRGYVTLHASCVATSTGAIAFVGQSGSGKSVLAAGLHSAGYGLIADDVTIVDADASVPVVYPGYPQCNLMPDAAEYFGWHENQASGEKAAREKITRGLPKGFPIRPVPLSRVYLIQDGMEIRTEPLNGHRAVFELVRHSYWIRLVHDARPSSYFLQCGRLYDKVPVRVLVRPRSMDNLPKLLTILQRDFLVS